MFRFGDLVVIVTKYNPIPQIAVVIEDESGDGLVYVMHKGSHASELIDVSRVKHCEATDTAILSWLFEQNGLSRVNEFAKLNPVNEENYRETIRYLQKSGHHNLPVIQAVVRHEN